MAKQLDYLDITKEEFWRLPRFDNSLPDQPKKKTKKLKRWRKHVQSGWLVGQYNKLVRGGPWVIEWFVVDLSGQFQKIMSKAW